MFIVIAFSFHFILIYVQFKESFNYCTNFVDAGSISGLPLSSTLS